MSTIYRWRVPILVAGLSLGLGACVAAPVAQLASQAIAAGAPASPNEVAQLPQNGVPGQAVHGLKAMLQRGLGMPDDSGAAAR